MPYSFTPENARTFTKEGTWFKDGDQRYIMFRGAGLASRSKLPPYLPVYPKDTPLARGQVAAEFVNKADRLSWLRKLGFNVVRLVIQWKGVTGNQLDTVLDSNYLSELEVTLDQLFSLGLYAFLDFHQDIAHEAYGGDGFPDWAIAVDDQHPWPATHPGSSYPWMLNYMPLNCPPWPQPPMSWLVRNTLSSFWHNRTTNTRFKLAACPVQDKLVQSISETARALSANGGHRAVLGYEPFNEPHQAGLAKADFEMKYLAPFYEKVIAAVAGSDPGTSVFVEPRVDWTVYDRDAPEFAFVRFLTDPSQIQTFLPSSFSGDRTVLSFHYYDMKTHFALDSGHSDDEIGKKEEFWRRIFQALVDESRSRDLIPFLTEFGAGNTPAWQAVPAGPAAAYRTHRSAYLDQSFRAIEENLLNATIWVFDPYAETDDGWNGETCSIMVKGKVNDSAIVARPYPMRSSALPVRVSFDSSTSFGVIMLEGRPVSAPTVVFVPAEVHYTAGFEIRVSGGDLQWDQASSLLYWKLDTTQSAHQLAVCPNGQFKPDALPPGCTALRSARAFSFP
jgi:hypothetical protein